MSHLMRRYRAAVRRATRRRHRRPPAMVQLWDDRAVQVIVNEGLTVMEGHTCRAAG